MNKMNTTITYTHVANLSNGMQVTFESVWPAGEVVGGLTFVETQRGIEYHIVNSVESTIATNQTNIQS
jgi:hypothetical protein